MLDPYLQVEILLHDQWTTWVANCLFAVMTIMNWDYLFGKTARYFSIESEEQVQQAAQASLVFSILSATAFTAYCYVAKEDYERSEGYITDAVPVAI